MEENTGSMADEIGLKTRRVLIDTSVYRQFGFNLRSRLFEQFASIASTYQLKVHLDPIISQEIDRGISEIAQKLVSEHRKYIKSQNQWNSRFTRFEKAEPMLEGDIARDARKQFDLTLKRIGMHRHGLGTQTVGQAVDYYFSRKPPFEKEGSREFPDYFILRAAEQEAARYRGMYIVTKDKAMLSAVVNFENLIPVAGLEAFMSIVSTLRDPAVEQVMSRFLANDEVLNRISEAFADAVGDEVLSYDGWDHEDMEIDKFEVENIDDPEEFVVISIKGDTVVLSGVVSVEGRVEGTKEIEYDEGPDRPPYKTREEVFFYGRTSAKVIVSFNRNTFDEVELEITEPYLNVSEHRRGY